MIFQRFKIFNFSAYVILMTIKLFISENFLPRFFFLLRMCFIDCRFSYDIFQAINEDLTNFFFISHFFFFYNIVRGFSERNEIRKA